MVAGEAGADVGDCSSNVFVGERAFPGRHHAVIGYAVYLDAAVEAAEDDADDFVRIAGDDGITGERRKYSRFALALGAVTRRAVLLKY